MKKNLIYLLAVTLLMGLFAACSQEETLEGKAGKSKLVSIVAELPAEFAKTRALPTANDHQLRCILEVWSKDATPVLLHHIEQVGDQATDGKLAFEFYLDNGTYDCLMWADFIDASATPTDERYADKYYNTSDLKKITIIDASKLYNNDACDGFFASQELEKTDEMGAFEATLKRPFAKLIVSEKNKANFALCKKVSVSHRIPASFNVAEGTVSNTETVAAELVDAAPIGAGDTDLKLFSCYAFAEADGALKQITLSFKKEDGTELRNTSIPAGVAFVRNHCTKAKGHLVAAIFNNTTVDVGVSDGWDSEIDGGELNPVDPAPEAEDPKVGSFYYADGTWSATLNESKECVGVIFALAGDEGAAKDDAIANYPATALTQITGWVVAATDAGAGKAYRKGSEITMDVNSAPANAISQGANDYLGYKNTQAFEGLDQAVYEAALMCRNYNVALSGVTSGWYLPSAGQLNALQAVYYDKNTSTDKTVKIALKQLEEKVKGKPMAEAYYWSSNIDATGKAFRAGFAPSTTGTVGSTDINKGSNIRSILTF